VRRVLFIGLVLLAAFSALVWAGSAGLGPVLITREDEQKIVLFYGNPMLVTTEPGISLRLPLLTDVLTFDKRHLYLNTEPLLIPMRDQERIDVDTYVVWRIADPVAFYSAFRDGLPQAEALIDRIVGADLREVVGQRTLSEVVTTSRVEIMQEVTRKSDEELRPRGIAIDDVRINRTELPAATEKNVFARMRTERERLARKTRAEGEEEGRRVRAEADRESRVLVAEAERDAEIERGKGDAEAAHLYAEAYAIDPDFYGFVRNLEAYRKAMGPGTTLVLSPKSEFFRVLDSARERDGP